MVVSTTLLLSSGLMVLAFGFGALLGFNLIGGADGRKHPKLYEYRYKPVTLTLSENEVRARIRALAEEKEALSVRAMMKGRAAKPVQRVTATMVPTPEATASAVAPEATVKPVVPEAAPVAKVQAAASVTAPIAEPAQAAKSADIINLGQRRPGLVFYRVEDRVGTEAAASSDTRPPVSPLAKLAPEALTLIVAKVGPGHEPFRLESADGQADELSLISGVTEALERSLNRLGIYHFWQIGAWSAEHVAWVAARVPGGERIARENWIAQAAKLIDMPRKNFNIDED